jgi:hypothetical protein
VVKIEHSFSPRSAPLGWSWFLRKDIQRLQRKFALVNRSYKNPSKSAFRFFPPVPLKLNKHLSTKW